MWEECTDAQGKDHGGDGITLNNVVALYTHLHVAGHSQVPVTLMQAARAQRKIRIPSYD